VAVYLGKGGASKARVVAEADENQLAFARQLEVCVAQ
jgi:hypothetical protein